MTAFGIALALPSSFFFGKSMGLASITPLLTNQLKKAFRYSLFRLKVLGAMVPEKYSKRRLFRVCVSCMLFSLWDRRTWIGGIGSLLGFFH